MRNIVKLIEVDGKDLSFKILKSVQVDNVEHLKGYLDSEEFKDKIGSLIEYNPDYTYKLLIKIKSYYSFEFDDSEPKEYVEDVTLLDVFMRSKKIDEILNEI